MIIRTENEVPISDQLERITEFLVCFILFFYKAQCPIIMQHGHSFNTASMFYLEVMLCFAFITEYAFKGGSSS